MMDKKHIQHLGLHWSLYSDEGCMDSQTEMDILCKLEPHQSLQSLEIVRYRGTRYPDWVGKPCYHNMTTITLSDCNNCFMLPSLGHLPSLRELSISDMKTLETINDSLFNNNTNNEGGSLLTVVPFPSLEYLEFESMPCWEVWSCSKQPGAFPQLKHLRIKNCPELKGDLPSDLPALEELEIEDCMQLTCSLPRAPAMREITIEKANEVWKLSDCWIMMSSLKTLEILSIRRCDSLTCLPLETFPNLKKLSIFDCVNLESLSVSEDVTLQNLTDLMIKTCPNLVSLAREGLAAPSLTKFVVSNCGKLESLPRRMNTLLPKLNPLQIYYCPRIESFPEEGMPPSLRTIRICDCEKLLSSLAWPSMEMLTKVQIYGPCDGIKSIPKEGLLPSSLKSLLIYHFSSLEMLDCKGLLHLTSLQELRIENCPKLENLAGERLPTSLTEFGITGCPLLSKQCCMKHPQIWPKISHIHRIQVDFKVIS